MNKNNNKIEKKNKELHLGKVKKKVYKGKFFPFQLPFTSLCVCVCVYKYKYVIIL
jgi:hypothetical protein